MNDIDRYWMGKPHSSKQATMDWIASKGKKTQLEVAMQYGITHTTIVKHSSALQKLGVKIDFLVPISCFKCGKDLIKEYPRFSINYQDDHNSNSYGHTTAYCCIDCGISLKWKEQKRFSKHTSIFNNRKQSDTSSNTTDGEKHEE